MTNPIVTSVENICKEILNVALKYAEELAVQDLELLVTDIQNLINSKNSTAAPAASVAPSATPAA